MTASVVLSALSLFAVSGLFAFETGGANDITAVSGRTSRDYVRKRLASGSFAAESYVFGKGGPWKGAKADASIDNVDFLDVAQMIAVPLAAQNFVPSREPKTTKLLLMVYWGTTHAPEHANESAGYENLQGAQESVSMALSEASKMPDQIPLESAKTSLIRAAQDQMAVAISAAMTENKVREQKDALNAMMLGYDSWWQDTEGDFRGTALESHRKDMIDELEEDRYFIVLMAYDFQLLWKEKKHKLLWETRFSIRQRHHEFDKDLPTMARYASQYFGQDTNGLVHKAIPMGHVEIGDVKSLGEVPGK
jgi:hypothetical protein